MRRFFEAFGITADTRILDIGGMPATWEGQSVSPRVTLLNIRTAPSSIPARMQWVEGNALALPFDGTEFDVVFSNSVIEHVGDLEAQRRFASEVMRLRLPYYIQTPNALFPIEPHFWGVGTHWVPLSLRPYAVRYASVWGWSVRPSLEMADRYAREISLVSPGTLKSLFPGSKIWRERIAGVTKSLMAVELRR
jgi:hypothetical protein